MAILNKNFLHGTIGPVVFKQLGNKQIMTSKVKPGKMKQTGNTKKAANTFGKASKLAAEIRNIFDAEIGIFRDRDMHSRFSAALNVQLAHARDPETGKFELSANTFAPLQGFEFNLYSTLQKHMIATPDMLLTPGKLTVLFPEKIAQRLVKFPARAIYCEIVGVVALIRLKDGLRVQVPEQQVIRLSKDNTLSRSVMLEFVVPDGCFCILSIFLQYYGRNSFLNNSKLNPGAICYAAISVGDYQEADPFFWIDMMGLKF